MKNNNRVPQKQWRKWSNQARAVFNRTYEFFMATGNQAVLSHPKMHKIEPVYWKTISWNAAWIAADACDDTIPDEVVTV
jgi:hypothetical protein